MSYFATWEFDSKDKAGSGKLMDATFIAMLNNARAIAGIPFHINSGYRTPERNRRVGGKTPGSSHLKGLAADIRCTGSRERNIILHSLIAAGFTRIGIARSFIHADCDTTKAQNVTWLYF